MNTRLAALIAVTALVLGPAEANIARADDAPLLRDTGVSLVIGQQGNDALHRIRTELASSLRRSVALPRLPALAQASQAAPGSAAADQVVQVSFNP